MLESNLVDEKEIKKFSDIASEWWNPVGKFQPLHHINLVRLEYIKEKIVDKFGSITNLKILDVGCGGGLASIPLANLGAEVLGIDAGIKNIDAANLEKTKQKSKVEFRNEYLENIDDKFDVVICLEVIEHVPDQKQFLSLLCSKVRKDGLLIISTLNRNMKSYFLGIIAAEYLLGWVDKGTHEYKKFIKPSEIDQEIKKYNFMINDMKGIEYKPLMSEFKITNNIDVNYILSASLANPL